MAAWASASELVKKYASPGPYEFIPVAAMRDAYPALPLPRETLQIAEPAAPRVDAAFTASLSGLTDSLYVARLKAMGAALASLSGRQAVKARVQQGILHALFGRLKEAEDTFRAAIADDPALVSPYVNLANVKLLGSDDKGALQVVKQGLARNADSALLNLLAARIYAAGGDSVNAAVYLARVKKTDPELATRFAGLAPSAASPAGGSQRSAERGATPVLIWGDQ